MRPLNALQVLRDMWRAFAKTHQSNDTRALLSLPSSQVPPHRLLKGNASNFRVAIIRSCRFWQVEVLFEEILKKLDKHNDGDISSHVRAAFKNSPVKHMVTASKTS